MHSVPTLRKQGPEMSAAPAPRHVSSATPSQQPLCAWSRHAMLHRVTPQQPSEGGVGTLSLTEELNCVFPLL